MQSLGSSVGPPDRPLRWHRVELGFLSFERLSCVIADLQVAVTRPTSLDGCNDIDDGCLTSVQDRTVVSSDCRRGRPDLPSQIWKQSSAGRGKEPLPLPGGGLFAADSHNRHRSSRRYASEYVSPPPRTRTASGLVEGSSETGQQGLAGHSLVESGTTCSFVPRGTPGPLTIRLHRRTVPVRLSGAYLRITGAPTSYTVDAS